MTIQKDKIPENTLVQKKRGIIKASRERIFPLFCPVREHEWIDGWNKSRYDFTYTKSGFVEKYSIFRENSLKKWLLGEKGITTWVTTVYEPEKYRQDFTIILGDIALLNRSIRLDEINAQRTLAQTTDTVTFLKEPLKGIKRRIFAIKLKAFLLYIGIILKYYIEKDKMLKIIPKILKRFLFHPI